MHIEQAQSDATSHPAKVQTPDCSYMPAVEQQIAPWTEGYEKPQHKEISTRYVVFEYLQH